MPIRADIRRSRRRQLRSFGFSPREADRLRDRNSTVINRAIATRQRTISRKSIARRTPEEQEQLIAIRKYRREQISRPEIAARIDTQHSRREQFRRWSRRRNGFPARIQNRITEWNLDAGFDPLDSYGYRLFYHRYVRGLSESEAIRVIEQTDS